MINVEKISEITNFLNSVFGQYDVDYFLLDAEGNSANIRIEIFGESFDRHFSFDNSFDKETLRFTNLSESYVNTDLDGKSEFVMDLLKEAIDSKNAWKSQVKK